jgi:putative transposase
MENDGHEENTIYRRTDDRFSETSRSRDAMPIKELCCQGGFADATFYKWRAKFGDMQASEAKRLRDLEIENNWLKKLQAEAYPDMYVLKDALRRFYPIQH